MFEDMDSYLLRSKEDRTSHIDLNQSCIEIDHRHNTYLRCLMAHHLKVKLNGTPHSSHVCHACNNSLCSNPDHLYFGTPKDNWQDSVEAGTYENLSVRTKRKYGEAAYKEMLKKAASKGGKLSSRKLDSDTINERLRDYRNDPKTRGMKSRLSKKWNVTHTQVSRFIKTYAGG